MAMNHRLLRPLASQSLADADAAAYLAAVEAADGQALEPTVRNAVTAFVVGCKSDGIWSAIKASCILMGARTLSGALVPLVGTAPTNNNFVSGDYSRKTGLVGDGSTKYLSTGLSYNAIASNSEHIAAYKTEVGTGNFVGGGITSPLSLSRLAHITGTARFDIQDNAAATYGTENELSFVAASRGSATDFEYRQLGTSTSVSRTSQTRANTAAEYGVFAANYGDIGPTGYSDVRLSFYSIGDAIDLAALDGRASALVAAIGAVLP